jgi:DNA-binding GntR family transcriptional regulator
MTETLLLEKTHLFDRIYDILWDKIGTGEIQPGHRLKDIEWAEKLQVSRTPVREAMRKMQHEGILLPLNSGGYQVRKLNDSDIIDLYRCRAALEAVAAEDAAENAKSSDVALLNKIIGDCDEAIEKNDLRTAFELNSRFHAAVLDLSSNLYVRQTCDSLRRMILFYRSSVLRQSQANETASEVYVSRLRIKQLHHRQIADAIAARDGQLAFRLMQNHVRETAEDLLPRAQGGGSK